MSSGTGSAWWLSLVRASVSARRVRSATGMAGAPGLAGGGRARAGEERAVDVDVVVRVAGVDRALDLDRAAAAGDEQLCKRHEALSAWAGDLGDRRSRGGCGSPGGVCGQVGQPLGD